MQIVEGITHERVAFTGQIKQQETATIAKIIANLGGYEIRKIWQWMGLRAGLVSPPVQLPNIVELADT